MKKNVDLTDTYIRVNVDGYSSASFTPAAIDTLMRRGEEAAKAQWNSLLALKKKIGISDNYSRNDMVRILPSPMYVQFM